MQKNILIIGAGKLGLPLAHTLHKQGHHPTVISKSPKTLDGITHHAIDVTRLDQNSFAGETFDWAYVILSPSERSLIGYQHTYANTALAISQALQNHPIKRLVYVSSTRVYGQNQGEWVDDSHDPTPDSQDGYGQILKAAELLWHAHWQDKLTIIRPSGLYDGTSPRLMHMAQNLDEQPSTQHFMNLIHYDDVVQFLAQLPSMDSIKPSYILSSDMPFCQVDFLNHLRNKQGLPLVKLSDNATITGKKLKASHLQDLGFVCRDILAD